MTLPFARTPRTAPRSTDLYSELREIIDDALSGSIEIELDKTLERVAATAATILNCRYVGIVVRNRDGGIETLHLHGLTDVDDGPFELPDSLAGLAARVVYDGVTIRTPDIALQPLALGLPSGGLRIREFLGVPIRSGARVIGGLFAAGHVDSRPLRRADEYEAGTLANAIGFLVDHARVTATLARREQWLQASVEFSRELVADVHANPLQMLVERILAVADVDVATVVVPAVDESKMVVASAAGDGVDELDARILDRDGTIHEVLFEEHEPMIVQLAGASAYRTYIDELGLDSALLVPMPGLPGGGGVLTLYRHADRPPFTPVEVEMASTLAAQIVLAMELAGTRADRERGALLAERDRIARDLHDNIIQQLFATGMTLQSVATELGEDQSERVYRAVDELDQTILQIRSTIYRLSAPALGEESGLRHRIDQVITRLEEVLGFAVDLDVSGPIDYGFSDEVGQDIIAVLQETLTNVAKHAGATAVHVSVALRDGEVTLVVADNGKGIGESARRSGLANLRARAESLGGSMTTESGSNGTRITWTAPAGS